MERVFWKTFFPDRDMESAYLIDYEGLFLAGYKCVIFDIDNTLVPHGAPADQRAKELFARLHALGFRTLLLSNNKEPRVKPFAEVVDSLFLCKANKPSKRGYETALRMLKCEKEHAVFVGDQLFTDVWGAKRVGILSYLVKPIHPKEEIQIVLKRYLEKPILALYEKEKRSGR